jgi:hypothetical protein
MAMTMKRIGSILTTFPIYRGIHLSRTPARILSRATNFRKVLDEEIVKTETKVNKKSSNKRIEQVLRIIESRKFQVKDIPGENLVTVTAETELGISIEFELELQKVS